VLTAVARPVLIFALIFTKIPLPNDIRTACSDSTCTSRLPRRPYTESVWVENGEHGSGLGCADTSEPVREQRLRPVLLPDHASESGRFGWLSST
jgi:hypothetical protein